MGEHQQITNIGELLDHLQIAVVSEDDFVNHHRDTMMRFTETTHDAFACYRTISYDTASNESFVIKQTDTTLEIIFNVPIADVIDNFECNAPYRMFVGMNGAYEVPPLKQSVTIYNTHFRTRFVIDKTCGTPLNEIVFKFRSLFLLNSRLRKQLVLTPHNNDGILFNHLNVTVPQKAPMISQPIQYFSPLVTSVPSQSETLKETLV